MTLPGYRPVASIPLASILEGDRSGTLSPEILLVEDPDADLIFLGEITPSGGTMLRVSDVGYATATGDSPANTIYADRLLSPYNVTLELPRPDELGRALGRLTFGVVEIETADGELDARLAESWEGREYLVKVGGTYDLHRPTEATLAFASFVEILRAAVESAAWEDGRIVLSLREAVAELLQPLQTNAYGGTGGLDGGEALSGQKIPLAWGEVFNAEPVLVDAADLIYQWSDGAVQAVTAVRDNGAALTDAGDVADIEAAPQPAGGTYITQNTGGYVRLGGAPEGRVTLDGQGASTGGYVNTTPTIARRIAVDRGGLADPQDLDVSSFLGFEVLDRPIGYYYRGDRELTVLDGLGELLAAADGWVAQTRDGRLRIGRHVDPSTRPAVVTVTDDQIEDLEDTSPAPPVWRVDVGYLANWAPQDPDGLAGGLSAEDREAYGLERRTATAEDASVKTTHKDARAVRLESYLQSAADAETLAGEILARLKVRRRAVSARGIFRTLFVRQPGDVVRIVSDAANLAGGANFTITALSEVARERTNDWELWG